MFPKISSNKAFRYLIGEGVLSLNGEGWLRHKVLFNKAFIQTEYDDLMHGSFEELSDKISSMIESTPTGIPIHDLVNRAVFQTMGLFAYNMNYQAVQGESEYFELYHRLLKGMRKLPKIILLGLDPQGPAGLLIPTLKKDRESLYAHIDSIIKETRVLLTNNVEALKGRKDVLAKALVNQSKLAEGYTDKEIAVDMLTIFLAGHDTTSGSISYSLYNLAKHPEYQERVKQEIRVFKQSGISINSLSLKNLQLTFPLLHKVILESWRLYPPAAGGFMRVAGEGATLAGYQIPKGTCIITSILSIHRSKKIWGEKAMEFRPERFDEDLSSAKNLVLFGEGQHKCHGFMFAEIQTFQGLVTLLDKFTFGLPEDSPHWETVQVLPTSAVMSPVDLKLIVSID